jgi:hypothetical protein
MIKVSRTQLAIRAALIHCLPADDRVMLFEKQQLRLRKAIQSQQMHQPPVPPQFVPAIPGSSRFGQYGGDAGSSNSPLSLSALNVKSNPALRVKSSGGGSLSPGKSSSGSQSPKAMPPFNNMVRATHGPTLASVVLPPAPTEKNIYEWEVDGRDASSKKRIFLDGSSYCPTNRAGLYVRELREMPPETEVDEQTGLPVPGASYGTVVGVVGSEELPEKYIDFQIVLTADEMSTLISRKRILNRSDLQHHKSQMSSANVHITTPYIDHSRVMRDHFRPNHPEKWVSKDDIRPNK